MANQALVKRINRARVLDAIRRRRPLPRSVLADVVGLDRKSITNLVGELLAEGLVEEVGTVRQGKGRPLTMLTLARDRYCAAGLAIQAEGVSGVVLDLGGERRRTVGPAPYSCAGAEGVLGAVAEVYGLLRAGLGGRLRGVGVAVPGIVDTEAGVVRRSVNLPALEGVALVAALGRFVREPLYLEESSRAKALAEKWFGAAAEARSFICIDLGVGVGAGLVQDRRLYAPPGAYAGEIGHVIVEPGGPPCRCGHRGCLEACISERTLVARVNAAEGARYRCLSEVREPGPAGREILSEAGYRLGLALAYVVNIVCPPLIVLNGALAGFGGVVLAAVERGLREGALADCLGRVRLAVSALTEADAAGAASRVLSEVYEVDGHVHV